MAVFVLVHGAWHGAWCWADLIGPLAAEGHACLTFDLPGAGSRALSPASYSARPFDPAAFAEELSPAADITQAMRTEATVEALHRAHAIGHGPVVLLGHSWGGLTVSHAAEMAPELVDAVVYMGAFLLPPGKTAGEMLSDQAFADAQVHHLFKAHPGAVRAMRLDPLSDDPAYGDALHAALGADVPVERFTAARHLMHCDEPTGTGREPGPITAERFGQIPRHYVHLSEDRTIPPPAQDLMVALCDEAMGSRTQVHPLHGSHSPHVAQPEALAALLAGIAEGITG